MVYQGGADIIDIKEPNEGALGAVPLSQIHHVVDDLWEKCIVSATIGDLPADSAQINEKVIQTAETGVDYVKVGMFSDRHIETCLPSLVHCTNKGIAIIAVLEYFVNRAKQNDLLTGLAGSLTTEDVPTLLKAEPDYVGFRTALCNNKLRTGHLNQQAIEFVRESIPIPENLQQKLA